ncbi:Uncharacterised protein [Staphylococcus muscae]|uniref:Uncharacterized protein n=2 Tax=Staphylococcus muscae TaxID=1294 RepID=A0A240BZJ3_9STAP|nr:Uncharacterised protein [Staphylococcus muscae]
MSVLFSYLIGGKAMNHLNETEQLEGIGKVSKEEIEKIELENHKKDEFVGLQADIKESSLWDTK